MRNNAGPGLSEADNVTVRDNLPSGMELTATPTVTVTAGSTTLSTCTGSAGATTFVCDLGTFSSGGAATITVPVRIVTVTSLPQNFTNTAEIRTTSSDQAPGNNTNSGSVSVNSSSIAGRVFRDFAADGAISAGDTGIAGVTMTLTGAAFDGTPVTRTVTTGPDGSWSFGFLPQGTYSVTRGAPGEGFLTDAGPTAGTEGGTVASSVEIAGITLPSNTAATDYIFPLVPQARIGIAKQALGTTVNPDGSFLQPFRLVVENFSLEALENVVVEDPLDGPAPRFGALAAPAAPATDPLAPGSYAIVAAPSGTCGGLNAGFDGAGSETAASGFTLAAGATCTIEFALRVQPTAPLPPVLASGGRYENQATVTGEGALSGQTSATNPQLSDLSQNGADPDPNGNGQGNEAGENTPTPVAPAVAPAIAPGRPSPTASPSPTRATSRSRTSRSTTRFRALSCRAGRSRASRPGRPTARPSRGPTRFSRRTWMRALSPTAPR